MAAAALVLTATVVCARASSRVHGVGAQPGDVRLVTADMVFAPARLEVQSGEVSMHVGNDDRVRHTFTIESLGVDVELPPRAGRRVRFDAPPGTYEVTCQPHGAGMTATLVVV